MEFPYRNDLAEPLFFGENSAYANYSDIFCKKHPVCIYSIGIGIIVLGVLGFAVYGLILVKKRLARCKAINKQTATDEIEKQNLTAEQISQTNADDENVYIDNELYVSTESLFLESGIAHLNTETFHWDQKIVSAEKIDLNQSLQNEESHIDLQEISPVECLKDINQIKPVSPEAIDWKTTCTQISNEVMSYSSSICQRIELKTAAKQNYDKALQETSFTEIPFKYLNPNRQAEGNPCFMEDGDYTELQDLQSKTNKSIVSPRSYQRKENMGNEMNKRRSFQMEQNIPEKPYNYNKNGANMPQLESYKRKSYSVAGNQITFEKTNNEFKTDDRTHQHRHSAKGKMPLHEEGCEDNLLYEDLEIPQENNHLESDKQHCLPPYPSRISENSPSLLKERSFDFEEEYADNCLYDDLEEILEENNHLQHEKNNYPPPHASSIIVNNHTLLKEGPSDFEKEYVDDCLYDDPEEFLQENNHLQHEKNNYPPPHASSITENNRTLLKQGPSDFEEEYVDNCLYDDPEEILQGNNNLQYKQNNYLPSYGSGIAENNPALLKEGPSDFEEEFVDNCLYDDPKEILQGNNNLQYKQNNYLPPRASSIAEKTPVLLKEGPSDFEEKYVDDSLYDDPEEFLQENNHLQHENNNCLSPHVSSTTENNLVLLNDGPSDSEEEYVDNCLYDDPEELLQGNNNLQYKQNNYLPSYGSSITENTPALLNDGPSDSEEEYVDNCLYDDPKEILQGNNHLQCEKNNCYSTNESSISENSLTKESLSNFEEECIDNCFYDNVEEILGDNIDLQCEKHTSYLPPRVSNISENSQCLLKEGPSDFKEENVDSCLYDDAEEILQENNHLQCEKNNYLPQHASSISENNPSLLKESPSDFTEEYVDDCLYDDLQEILKENINLES